MNGDVRYWHKADMASALHMSAFGGKADMRFALHMSAFDPKRTSAVFPQLAALARAMGRYHCPNL